MTECSSRNREGIGRAEQITLDFPGGKPITLAFDAEDVTSDSGLAALGALDARLDLLAAAMRFGSSSRRMRWTLVRLIAMPSWTILWAMVRVSQSR